MTRPSEPAAAPRLRAAKLVLMVLAALLAIPVAVGLLILNMGEARR